MAVKIRLKRMGKIRQPYFRIVVADSRTKRDGRVIEEIGRYHPKQDPSLIEVDSERVQYWLGVGAQPSEPVAAILRVTGDWQRFRGEPAPEPMQQPAAKRDKTEIFNEALKDAHAEPAAEAVTTKRPARKAAAASGAAEQAASAEPAPADAPAAPTQASAEEAAVPDAAATSEDPGEPAGGDEAASEPAAPEAASEPAAPEAASEPAAPEAAATTEEPAESGESSADESTES